MTSEASSRGSARPIAISLTVAIVVLAGFNWYVASAARNSMPRQLIRTIDSSRGVTDLALGNSLIAAGFDAATFDLNMKPLPALALNAGLGATSPVQHLAFLREALGRERSIKVVIYGFYDFQLSEPPIVRNADLIGNYAASYYLEPDLALHYYGMNPRDRLEFEVMRRVPMMAERGTIWEKVEKLRRAMATIGMPREQSNRFGRTADFSLLEASGREAFAAACERWSEPTAGLSAPILEFIRESKAHRAKVVFVEMPMHPFHQRVFYEMPQWREYRSRLREMIAQTGSEYISASDWIEDPAEFADHLHLGPSGAKDFSSRLAVQLKSASPH